MYPCRHREEHTKQSHPFPLRALQAPPVFVKGLPQVVQPPPLMNRPDPPQFVTGHLSVWDKDGDKDEDVDVGVVQDMGVVHYMGVSVSFRKMGAK